jgi:formate dehydrogenase subunit delta
MLPADLVRMANQIADFFAAYPDEEAVSGVADHLRSFWPPSMRNELFVVNVSGDATLHPLVQRAIEALRDADPAA